MMLLYLSKLWHHTMSDEKKVESVSGIVKMVDKISTVYTKNDVRILNGIDKYSSKHWQKEDTTSTQVTCEK
jgi:hypothetical protein